MVWQTYVESENSSTLQGAFKAFKPWIAAVNSIRLLVVWSTPPLNAFLVDVPGIVRMAAQPPGPGFPEQAPSQ